MLYKHIRVVEKTQNHETKCFKESMHKIMLWILKFLYNAFKSELNKMEFVAKKLREKILQSMYNYFDMYK